MNFILKIRSQVNLIICVVFVIDYGKLGGGKSMSTKKMQ